VSSGTAAAQMKKQATPKAERYFSRSGKQ